MKDKTTSELDKELDTLATKDINDFLSQNEEYLAVGDRPFYHYFKNIVRSKRLLLKDVYIAAGLSESFGEKLVQMNSHTRQRDHILRLCIAGHFSLIETNKALKLYNMQPLYSKNRRDVCIIVAINNRKFDLIDIDEILVEQNLEPLSKEVD